jgi:hypothetical protein
MTPARFDRPMPGKHIARLVTASGRLVDATVIEGGYEDAVRWHQDIQPHVTAMDRLDKAWNWPRLVTYLHLFERLAQRNAVFLQINVSNDQGVAIPVGQALVSDRFPYFPRQRERCVFLWFLAAAPETALRAHKLPADLKLGRPLVDLGLQLSFQRNYAGLSALHAASSDDRLADQALYDLYEKGVGLIPVKRSLFVSLFRRNDGRYFHTDEKRALDLSQKLDKLR